MITGTELDEKSLGLLARSYIAEAINLLSQEKQTVDDLSVLTGVDPKLLLGYLDVLVNGNILTTGDPDYSQLPSERQLNPEAASRTFTLNAEALLPYAAAMGEISDGYKVIAGTGTD